MRSPWIGLLLSFFLVAGSALALPGEGFFRGFPIPPWGEVILLFVGIYVGFISLRALLRGEGKEPEYTDEDIEKAKIKLEKMYVQEHGSRPGVPGEKAEAESTFEAKRKK